MNELTKKILEVLEIEPDVEFEVINKDTKDKDKCRFNAKNNKFEVYNDIHSQWIEWVNFIILVMADVLSVIKTPWKPKYNEIYYFIEENGNINEYRNDNSYLDLMCWHMGNCFKTKEEAEANKDKIMKLYESDIPLWQKVEDKE